MKKRILQVVSILQPTEFAFAYCIHVTVITQTVKIVYAYKTLMLKNYNKSSNNAFFWVAKIERFSNQRCSSFYFPPSL